MDQTYQLPETFKEVCQKTELTSEEVDRTLYFYVNMEGQTTYMHKPDRNSYPIDEFEMIGYAFAYGSLEELRKYLKDLGR